MRSAARCLRARASRVRRQPPRHGRASRGPLAGARRGTRQREVGGVGSGASRDPRLARRPCGPLARPRRPGLRADAAGHGTRLDLRPSLRSSCSTSSAGARTASGRHGSPRRAVRGWRRTTRRCSISGPDRMPAHPSGLPGGRPRPRVSRQGRDLVRLADAYFHSGLSAGVGDLFRFAEEAFRRGWAIDSAAQISRAPTERAPLLEERSVTLSSGPRCRGIRRRSWRSRRGHWRLTRPARWPDTGAGTGPSRWARRPGGLSGRTSTRWIRARSDGSSSSSRAQASAHGSRPQRRPRHAVLGVARAGSRRVPAGHGVPGRRPARRGRPSVGRHRAGRRRARGAPARLAAGRRRRRGKIGMALYRGGDTARAAAAAARLTPLAGGHRSWATWACDQLEARCVIGAWRARGATGPMPRPRCGDSRGPRARTARLGLDIGGALTTLCAGCSRQGGRRPSPPDARRALDSASVASRAFEIDLPALGANLVVAEVAERQGDLLMALRALRRRAGYYRALSVVVPSTYLREEGRVAALAGDTASALRAYRHYRALRPDPRPRCSPRSRGACTAHRVVTLGRAPGYRVNAVHKRWIAPGKSATKSYARTGPAARRPA